MRPLLAAILLAGAAGCDSAAGGRDPGERADGELPESMALAVELAWSTGEGEEDEPLDPSIDFDEDEGEFSTAQMVELGPVSECAKPPAERDEDAVCSWRGPSTWWDLDLAILARPDGPTLQLSASTGDLDTLSVMELPLDSVPAAQPWTFRFSPDEAGGVVGSIEGSIQRIAER